MKLKTASITATHLSMRSVSVASLRYEALGLQRGAAKRSRKKPMQKALASDPGSIKLLSIFGRDEVTLCVTVGLSVCRLPVCL